MNEHIDKNGQFQSDKYEWCKPGFVPLKFTDPMAQDLLAEYARRRQEVDASFSEAVETCLKAEGYVHHPGMCLRRVVPCTSKEAHEETLRLQAEREKTTA